MTALALGMTTAVSGEAEAKKKAPKAKMCKATNPITGQNASWRCGGTEKCCYSIVTGKGTCAPANGICL